MWVTLQVVGCIAQFLLHHQVSAVGFPSRAQSRDGRITMMTVPKEMRVYETIHKEVCEYFGVNRLVGSLQEIGEWTDEYYYCVHHLTPTTTTTGYFQCKNNNAANIQWSANNYTPQPIPLEQRAVIKFWSNGTAHDKVNFVKKYFHHIRDFERDYATVGIPIDEYMVPNENVYMSMLDEDIVENADWDRFISIQRAAVVTSTIADLEEEGGKRWATDQMNDRSGETDGNSNYKGEGDGVRIVIVDTGLHLHEYYGNRLLSTYSKDFTRGHDYSNDYTTTNSNVWHGTQTGICALGKDGWGIANKAELIQLKVLTDKGTGSYSNIVYALQYILQLHTNNAWNKTVINMSVGFSNPNTEPREDDLLTMTINKIIDADIAFVQSAGNENGDACNYGHKYTRSLKIGALDKNHFKAEFSNYGDCVSLWAPGKSVPIPPGFGGSVVSGTSFASPYVAGLVASLMSTYNYGGNDAMNHLTRMASDQVVRGVNGRWAWTLPPTTDNIDPVISEAPISFGPLTSVILLSSTIIIYLS